MLSFNIPRKSQGQLISSSYLEYGAETFKGSLIEVEKYNEARLIAEGASFNQVEGSKAIINELQKVMIEEHENG